MMRIRKAVPDDSLSIANTHMAAWQSAYRAIIPDERLSAMNVAHASDRFRDNILRSIEDIYVAEMSNEIVGFISVGSYRDETYDDISVAELYALYVHPNHWRKQIGKMLTREAEKLLKLKDFTHIVLWVFKENMQARKFYESEGFLSEECFKTMNIGTSIECIRYKKELMIT
ncbi:GNAT family N-acetyltransferase [uncultured Sulfuricurvum sp.]|uniref:GNAT family N-acetyltransferase n=1 Tax=uncultured Sulfuricurvum sp. TaxID=430693 RepID=UPI00260FF952|nr:GNAT family N-acetyltransferase [uncultured Sulfuricurvum sp.]